MIDHGSAKDDVAHEIVTERVKRTEEELRRKLRGPAKVSCTLRHVARGIYEATLSVIPERGGLVVARKRSKNVFTALAEASRAALRQAQQFRERARATRHLQGRLVA